MGIFRAYDIRGVYGRDLGEKKAAEIARAFKAYVGGGKLVVACDVRPSSPQMKKSVVEALLESGCGVIDAGTIPTPLFYYSIVHYDCNGGAMVTASHNPPEYNGMKLCGKERGLVKKIGYDAGLAEIEKTVESGQAVEKAAKRGTLSVKNPVPDYTARVLEKVKPARKLRVALDCGNGVAGSVAPAVLKKLCSEVHELYCDPDPSFPNHAPDPTKEETLDELRDTVKQKGLDLGIALDGDGDRAVFIDEKSRIVRGDVALAVFAEKILEKKPGATFITEVKASRGAIERIKELGGRAVMWRVGHAYLHEKMKTEKAEATGELSGHFFFRDNYGNDDGIFAAAKMIEVVAAGTPLSKLAERVPKYVSTPEIRVHCDDDKKFAVVDKVTAVMKKKYDVLSIDGARIELPNAWGLVRASNTEPALTLRFEGKTQKDLEEIRAVISGELEKYGIGVP